MLRPGGTLLFNVWDDIEHNEFADVVTAAVATLFPDDPPRFLARTPHGYHDVDRISSDVAAAGLHGTTAHRSTSRLAAEPRRAPSRRSPTARGRRCATRSKAEIQLVWKRPPAWLPRRWLRASARPTSTG